MRPSNTTKCLFLDVVLFDLDNALGLYITSILTCVINGVFALCAVIGNSLILTAVVRTSALLTCANLFLGNLVMADLLAGLLTQPFYIAYKAGELRGQYSCTVHQLFSTCAWLCNGISFLTLTCLNCERYVAIFNPLRYPSLISRRRVFYVSLGIWLLASLVVSGRFFGLSNITFHVVCALIIVLNLGTLGYVAVRIYRVVYRHHRRIAGQQQGRTDSQTSSIEQARETKAGQSVLWITTIHFLCYLPTLCMIIAYTSLGYGIVTKMLYCWSDTILFLNSSLNPVIYCWKNRTIRKAVTRFLFERMRRTKPTTIQQRTQVNYDPNQGCITPRPSCPANYPNGSKREAKVWLFGL